MIQYKAPLTILYKQILEVTEKITPLNVEPAVTGYVDGVPIKILLKNLNNQKYQKIH